jgi:hypothetical protein
MGQGKSQFTEEELQDYQVKAYYIHIHGLMALCWALAAFQFYNPIHNR